MLRGRKAMTGVLASAVVLLLAGCSEDDHARERADDADQQAWMSQMTAQFGDGADSRGGLGGRLIASDSGSPAASGSMQSAVAGRYDLVAVCRSTTHVHVTVRTFRDVGGDVTRAGATLGQVDVTCGTTARTTIDVPSGSDGLVIEATTADRSGRALFDTFILDPAPS
ncbi:hypothetical protein HUN59_03720 [Curtobacterium sp. Csp2]|uniref:hypothetical protein n=1 Tax=Curtobacterium sp. Csp2 TaxID=2495430 RepID=UPI0015806F9A|nr:hypothetical protein [Curtobacterium sp. Csp2]QKS15437.1 hypothetical protein HUN59_03720 [Curtobacterium sp. Csp2]